MTDGLGVYELLRLSELLGCASQLSIYTGYSMGAKYVPLNESAPFAADAVDLLEFANGDAAATAWGARRAAMGHAAPFGLRRLEVGNAEQLGRKGPPALSVGKRPAWTVLKARGSPTRAPERRLSSSEACPWPSTARPEGESRLSTPFRRRATWRGTTHTTG